MGSDDRGLGLSFWRLGLKKRVELVWEPVARLLGATRYVVGKRGAEAELYTPHVRYHYKVVNRSDMFFLKNFAGEISNDWEKFNGNLTVVVITIAPPPPQLVELGGLKLKDPPLTLRIYDGYAVILALSTSLRVIGVKRACLAPLWRLNHIIERSGSSRPQPTERKESPQSRWSQVSDI